MIHFTLAEYNGNAYEITDRYTAPRSSAAIRIHNDLYSLFQLVRH